MFLKQGVNVSWRRWCAVVVCLGVIGSSAAWASSPGDQPGGSAHPAKKKRACKKATKKKGSFATAAKKKRRGCRKRVPSHPGGPPFPIPVPPVAKPPTTSYALAVSKSGAGLGTVTSAPAGINCGTDCAQVFESGQTVSLSVEAGPASVFVGWSGACSGAGACQVSMSGDKTVTAEFAPLTYTLSISPGTGSGSGSISSSPPGISCPGQCSAEFDAGTNVQLTPTADVGSVFTSWTGDCNGAAACQVTMNGPHTVGATFESLSHPLTITKMGNGLGKVTSQPAGIDCGDTCTKNFGHGEQVTLTASEFPPSSFAGWGGACSGMATTCTVDMSEARDVTATFTLDSFTLTVTVSGNGTVETENGINCPGDCTETYTEDTIIPVTATPSPGNVFAGWTGACTGLGGCTLLMDQNRSLTAMFVPG